MNKLCASGMLVLAGVSLVHSAEEQLLLRRPLFLAVERGVVEVGTARDAEIGEGPSRLKFPYAYHLSFLHETGERERPAVRSDIYAAVKLSSRSALDHYEEQILAALQRLGPLAFRERWVGYNWYSHPFLTKQPLSERRQQMYGVRHASSEAFAYDGVVCFASPEEEQAWSFDVRHDPGAYEWHLERFWPEGDRRRHPGGLTIADVCGSLARIAYVESEVVETHGTSDRLVVLEIASADRVHRSEKCAPLPELVKPEVVIEEEIPEDIGAPKGEARTRRRVIAPPAPPTVSYDPAGFTEAQAVYVRYGARITTEVSGNVAGDGDAALESEFVGSLGRLIGLFPCGAEIPALSAEGLRSAIGTAYETSQTWAETASPDLLVRMRIEAERGLERYLDSAVGSGVAFVCSGTGRFESEPVSLNSANYYVAHDEGVVANPEEVCEALRARLNGD